MHSPSQCNFPRVIRGRTAAALVLAAGLALGSAGPARALVIELVDTGGVAVGSQAYDGFRAAAAMWEDVLFDDVTVRLNVGFNGSLASSVLGSTATSKVGYSYSAVRSALIGDASSAADASAVSHLQSGSGVAMVTNNASGTAYYDNDGSTNNTSLSVTRANAKALGLLADNGSADASITFNSAFGFDFNQSDGISGYDFVGIAAHEIGHALGFVSGVDYVDVLTSAGIGINNMSVLTVLDLMRFSDRSLAYGAGVIDAATGGDPYFSTDGGATNEGWFSTGKYLGNGRQASHWRDDMGYLMDPTVGWGQKLTINPAELVAFDAIGWDTVVNDPISTELFVTMPSGTIRPVLTVNDDGTYDDHGLSAVKCIPLPDVGACGENNAVLFRIDLPGALDSALENQIVLLRDSDGLLTDIIFNFQNSVLGFISRDDGVVNYNLEDWVSFLFGEGLALSGMEFTRDGTLIDLSFFLGQSFRDEGYKLTYDPHSLSFTPTVVSASGPAVLVAEAPEPPTLLIFGFGLAGLIAWHAAGRRNRRPS